MNQVNVQSYAKSIHTYVGVEVLLPEELERGRKYPWLLLLHSRGKGRSQWRNSVLLEEAVDKNKLIIVLAQGNQSGFTNLAQGERWEDYVVSELPDQLEDWFPIRTDEAGHLLLRAGEGLSREQMARAAAEALEKGGDLGWY